jgi:hypothetical protein
MAWMVNESLCSAVASFRGSTVRIIHKIEYFFYNAVAMPSIGWITLV